MTLIDPRTKYPVIAPPEQTQQSPGLDKEMAPLADRGEDSYVGSGKLEGRKALITGADSRIGAAVAIPGDLSHRQACRDAVDKTVSELGGIDILVNNAGRQIAHENFLDITEEEWDETMRTNIYAPFFLAQAAVPHMEPGSSIIFSSSIQAYDPSAHLVHYAVTKAAMNNMSKGLSMALLGEKGIRVNAVAPGPIWTLLQPSKGQPMEKLTSFGQPAELAGAYVSGETLAVTGGGLTP